MFCVWGITQLCIDVMSKCMVVLGMEKARPKMLAEKRLMILIMTNFMLGVSRTLGFGRRAEIFCTFSFSLTRSRGTNINDSVYKYSLSRFLRGGA